MERKDFLKSGLIIGTGSIIGSTNGFSQNLTTNEIDKLVDANGNYVQPPLPYAESFLEPYMDAETLHLHYTFHHGGATKAANKDAAMIKKALDENNLETVDYWTKKLTHHSSSHILHSIFWTNLINKKTILFSASTAVVPTVIRLLFYLLSLHFVSLHTLGSETSSPFFACPFGQNKSSLDNKIKKAQMTRYIPGTNRHSEIISNKKEMPRKTSCCFLVTLVEHNNPSM